MDINKLILLTSSQAKEGNVKVLTTMKTTTRNRRSRLLDSDSDGDGGDSSRKNLFLKFFYSN